MEKVREDAGVRRGREVEVARHCVFPLFCGFGGSNRRLATAAGAETSGQMRDEQLHAVVVRSTFGNEKRQKVTAWEHF